MQLTSDQPNESTQYDLVLEVTDLSPAGSSPAGAAGQPAQLSLPFSASVFPTLKILNDGFTAGFDVWAGTGYLRKSGAGNTGYYGVGGSLSHQFVAAGSADATFSAEGLPTGADLSSDGLLTWDVQMGDSAGSWKGVITVTDNSFGVERTGEGVAYFVVDEIGELSDADYASMTADGQSVNKLDATAVELDENGQVIEFLNPAVYGYLESGNLVAKDSIGKIGTPSLLIYNEQPGALWNNEPSETEVTIESEPEYGSIEMLGPKIFIYHPDEDFPGYDEFEYSVKGYNASFLVDSATESSNTARVTIGSGVSKIESAGVVQGPAEDDGDQGGINGQSPGAGGGNCSCECVCGSGPSVSVAPGSGTVGVNLPGGGTYRNAPDDTVVQINVETRQSSSTITPENSSQEGEESDPPASSTVTGARTFEVYGINRLLDDVPILLTARDADLGVGSQERSIHLPVGKDGLTSAYYNHAVSTWGGQSPLESDYGEDAWIPVLGGDDYGFGPGWNFAEIERLVVRPDDPSADPIYWLRADGRINSFDSLGAEANRSSGGAVVTTLANGGYQIADAGGQRLTFDSWGWLTQRADAYGNTIAYTYEGAGTRVQKLMSTTSSRTGETTNFVWEGSKVIEIVDPNERVTEFGYSYFNSADNVLRLASRTLPSPDGVSEGLTTQFDYDKYGRIEWFQEGGPSQGYTLIEYNDQAGIVRVTAPDGTLSETYIDSARPGVSHTVTRGNDGVLDSFPTPLVSNSSVESRGGSAVNADGLPQVFETDPEGRVSSVTRLDGVTTEYVYNGRGQVLRETIDTGREVTSTNYQYDGAGRLVVVYHPDTTPEDGNGPPTQEFEYDAWGRMTLEVDELGRTTRTDYTDFAGRPGVAQSVRTTHQMGDLGGGDDLVSEEHFRADGLVERTVAFRNDVDGTPLDSLVTTYAYSSDGLADVVTYGPDTAGDGVLVPATAVSVQVLERDDDRNPRLVADELGRVTTHEYDWYGRTKRVIGPTPRFGEPQLEIEYAYTDRGQLQSETRKGHGIPFGDALVTSYTYDENGRTKSVTTSGSWGSSSIQNHYENGNLVATIDPLGRETGYGYDLLGRVNKVALPDPDGPSEPRRAPVNYFTYDALGRVTAEVDPAGAVVRTTYDTRGRVTEVRNTDGASFSQTDDTGQLVALSDDTGRTTRRAYDDAGRLVSQWSPGREAPTTFQYDTAGNLRFQTNPLGETTELTYDAFGRLESEIDPNGAVTTFTYYADGQTHTLTDPLLNTTTWTYDGAGRLVAETNQSGDTRTYGYDVHGRRTHEIDRLGRVIAYEYDHLGQVRSEKWYATEGEWLGATIPLKTYTYTIDAAGQLGNVSELNQSYSTQSRHSFSYDDLGLVTSSSRWFAGFGSDLEFEYQYDHAGRQTGQQADYGVAELFANTYRYDLLGRVRQITQAGDPVDSAIAEKRVDFTYGSLGQLAVIDRFADLAGLAPVVATSLAYDWAGRVEQIAHGDLVTHDYAYDTNDRLARYGNSIDGETLYTYDGRGQLLGVDQPDALLAFGIDDETYAYDDNGNRESAGTATYDTGVNNRLDSDGTYFYEYDAEGNRTARFVDDGDGLLGLGDLEVTLYDWDHRNRLTSVLSYDTFGGTEQKRVEHGYDVFNQWISREVTQASQTDQTDQTVWLYEDGQVVVQFDKDDPTRNFADSDLSHRYLWGPGIDQLLADEQVETTSSPVENYWALADHLGTIRDLADNTGDLANHRVYDSYGRLAHETDTAIEQLFGYTGKALDEETGLQNNLNRWYDASVGRWISEDPIGFAGGDANLSRYVGNGATNWVDPNGLAKWRSGIKLIVDSDTAEFVLANGRRVKIRNAKFIDCEVSLNDLSDLTQVSADRIARIQRKHGNLRVKFDQHGQPDFSRVRETSVSILDPMASNYAEVAWEKLRNSGSRRHKALVKRMGDYQWHHAADGRLELLDADVHIAYQHTGLKAVWDAAMSPKSWLFALIPGARALSEGDWNSAGREAFAERAVPGASVISDGLGSFYDSCKNDVYNHDGSRVPWIDR